MAHEGGRTLLKSVRRSGCRYRCAAIALSVFIATGCSSSSDDDPETTEWDETPLPRIVDGVSASLLRARIHPFLAEYERKVRMESASLGRVEVDLPLNYGGRTWINVYTCNGGAAHPRLLRLHDYFGDCLLDLETGARLEMLHTRGRTYLGQDLSAGASLPTRYADGRESKEPMEWKVKIRSRNHRDITDIAAGPWCNYLGRIDGRQGPLRFIDRDESAEEPMKIPHRSSTWPSLPGFEDPSPETRPAPSELSSSCRILEHSGE